MTILATEKERAEVSEWAAEVSKAAKHWREVLASGEKTFGQQDITVLFELDRINDSAAKLHRRLEVIAR